MTNAPIVRLFVWSDYVCPFCYLELPVLDRLRDAYGSRVSIDWRAFELRPDPEPALDPDSDYLHDIWGGAVYPMAEQRGMTLRLPPVQPRSRKAHEAAAFARSAGRFEAMHETLFRAFFEDGFDIGDEDILTDLARSAGIDGQALKTALRGGRFTEVALNDQRLARRMGLTGVPAVVVAPDESLGGQPLLVSGAQPYDVVAGAVEQVLAAGRKPS